MATSAWGSEETRYFYELTPERILDAVERATGQRATGRSLALNSMENRVYEVEIELDHEPRTPAERFVIAKFYRPGRWRPEQIRAEHRFLSDLAAAEIPAVAPLADEAGETLHPLGEEALWYTVFPKVGGRSPDELGRDDLARVGRLLARMHNVGAAREAPERVRLSPTTYGLENLDFLLEKKLIPAALADNYAATVRAICTTTAPWFAEAPVQRIHGDCHLGNLLYGRDGFFWVDFDDMVEGPPVQDLWLLVGGRDHEAQQRMRELITAYEMMRPFDRTTLRLIEPLRALRFVHFAAWIGKRWEDPAFQRAFPQYGSDRYWQESLADLREQLSLLHDPIWL